MTQPTTRVRHEIVSRILTVESVIPLTPLMTRIVFAGENLEGFVSLAPDDHIKLYFPSPTGEAQRRDFTPRHYDKEKNRLTIDFALHDAGPASDWARQAKPAQTLEIAGPRGSLVVSDSFNRWLLIGDETALPAIGRRIEELAETAEVVSVVTVAGPEEEQRFVTKAAHKPIWVYRPHHKADDPQPLLNALADVALPEDGFVFVAAEGKVAKAVRNYLVSERGQPANLMRAAGYWMNGRPDAHVSLDD